MKDIIDFLCYTIPIRRGKKNKLKFLTYLCNEFTDKKLECKMYKEKEGIYSIFNLVVGDIQKASNIILVGYDTPTMTLGDMWYYPLDATLNDKNEKRNTLLHILLISFFSALCLIGAYHIIASTIQNKTAYSIVLAALMFVIGLSANGVPNFYNINKNTVSVALAMKLLYDDSVKKEKLAVVFLDRTSDSYLGYKNFCRICGETIYEKNIYILECLGNGMKNYLAYNFNFDLYSNNRATKIFNLFKVRSSDSRAFINIFKRCLYFFCADESEKGLTVKHIRGRKDRFYELENANAIYKGIKSLLEQ